MSLTPGWIEKEVGEDSPEVKLFESIGFFCDFVRMSKNWYFIDNGSEYKKYPRTKEGWEALCDDLKGFEP